MYKVIEIGFYEKRLHGEIKIPFVTGDYDAYKLIFDTGRYPDAVRACIYAKRPDGVVVYDCMELQNGENSYIMSTNMYSAAGEGLLRIVLQSSGGGILTAAELSYTVLEGVDGDVLAEDDDDCITKIISQLDTKADRDDIVSKTSELENDSGFISLGTDLSHIQNGFIVEDAFVMAYYSDQAIGDVKQLETDDKDGLVSAVNEVYRRHCDSLIENNATGVGELVLSDCANDMPLFVKVYGESVQNGTPTPDLPVEVISLTNPTLSQTDGEYGIAAVDFGDIVLRKIGDFADYIDLERGVMVRRVGSFEFADSTMKASEYTVSSYELLPSKGEYAVLRVYFNGKVNSKLAIYNDASMMYSPVMMTKFSCAAKNDVRGGKEFYGRLSRTSEANTYVFELWLGDSALSRSEAVELLRSYGSFTVYYQATETEEKLSEEQCVALRTQYGQNILTVTDDNGLEAVVDAEYTADTKLYIDEKFNQLTNAIVALGGAL